MPDRSVISFAPLHLEGNLLFAALMLDDVHHHAGAGNGRRTNRHHAVLIDEQHALERVRLPRIDSQPFDFERVAGRDAILFSTRFEYSVHWLSRVMGA